MAIATFDRDQARAPAASEPRFKLLQELCRAGDAVYWRAHDRRGSRTGVVRVFEGTRDDTSRRLGDLHRERTLADRLAHPDILRTDVPLIEGERIYQLVDPEPVRVVDPQSEGGRLAILTLLVAVARVLADVHARGAFHGSFSRASCLRSADGRLSLHGFTGDAPAAAAVRDGMAADHRAFLEFAQGMLEASGGAPPRLRRYFARHLAPDAPRPPAGALAELADELRESLEDTFPWPAAVTPPEAPTAPVAKPARSAARPPAAAPVAEPTMAAPQPVAAQRVTTGVAGAANSAARRKPERSTPVALPAAQVPAPAESIPAAPTPVIQVGAVAAPQAVATVDEPPAPREAARAPAPADAWYPPSQATALQAADEVDDVDAGHPRRSLRPWLAAILVLGAALAFWQFGAKASASRPPAGSVPAATGSISTPTWPASDAGSGAPQVSREAAVLVPAAGARDATPPASADAPATRQARASERTTAQRPPTRPATAGERSRPAVSTGTARQPAAAPVVAKPAAEAAQATRSRVATLVAGGNRALNALEPEAAREAFAAALALAPNDAAAVAGSQRARRLAGVAALMRDAREAAARGDHARAVQGYAQALSNDPRNRGLADALATARRNLASDSTGRLLADGHAALGAGRLEAARSAFERALAADPAAPGARRGVEQAITAIALRDEAAARRLAAVDRGS